MTEPATKTRRKPGRPRIKNPKHKTRSVEQHFGAAKKAAPGQLDFRRALQQRLFKRMTYGEIAREQGVSVNVVVSDLKNLADMLGDNADVQEYVEKKSRVLDGVEYKLLSYLISDKVLEKASLGNIAFALREVFRENHLVKGQATDNLAIFSITDKERKELQEYSEKAMRGAVERERERHRIALRAGNKADGGRDLVNVVEPERIEYEFSD